MDDLNALHRRQIDSRLRVLAFTEALLDKDVSGMDALSADLLPPLPPEGSPVWGRFHDMREAINGSLIAAGWVIEDALAEAGVDPRGWLAAQRAAALADRPPFT